MKHIDLKYHFLREEIANKTLELQRVPSADNIADIFTNVRAEIRHVRSDRSPWQSMTSMISCDLGRLSKPSAQGEVESPHLVSRSLSLFE